MSVAARLFHALTIKRPAPVSAAGELDYEEGSLERFLGRFGGELDFRGKTVLDVGCGGAVLCVAAARRGAQRVTGVDLDVSLGRRYLSERGADVADRVELIETEGRLHELDERRFAMIVSKDSFEHYDDPEGFISTINARLAPGGELVIGFGPLWKSPTGGHINYMTRFPRAQLLFSERIIFEERRRFRPDENARHWSEIRGSLNQMTYGRFMAIVRASGLECRYLDTNVSDNSAVRAMKALSRVPGLSEYFTQSVYAILRKPA